MRRAFDVHVGALLRQVAEDELLPRFQSERLQVHQKSPGEWVTEADLAAEEAIVRGLQQLTPGVPVVGEERAHHNPALLNEMGGLDRCWVVDPVDGTKHYAAGTGPFGTMVAWMVNGRTEAAWIYLPLTGELAVAWRGGGTTYNGQAVRLPQASNTRRGGLLTRFFPESMRARADALPGIERTDGAHHCAARRYVDMLLGREQFAAYWRTSPWDHAPGVLMVIEAGGVALRFDRKPYRAVDVHETGLLVASDSDTWNTLHASLIQTG